MDASDAGKPDWWLKARKLEAENRMEEAEALIKNAVPNLYFAEVTADLYRLRMLRLMEARDKTGAREAFRQAKNFIHFFASMATSGGEGAALSGERDAFMKRLVAAYGGDPD